MPLAGLDGCFSPVQDKVLVSITPESRQRLRFTTPDTSFSKEEWLVGCLINFRGFSIAGFLMAWIFFALAARHVKWRRHRQTKSSPKTFDTKLFFYYNITRIRYFNSNQFQLVTGTISIQFSLSLHSWTPPRLPGHSPADPLGPVPALHRIRPAKAGPVGCKRLVRNAYAM